VPTLKVVLTAAVVLLMESAKSAFEHHIRHVQRDLALILPARPAGVISSPGAFRECDDRRTRVPRVLAYVRAAILSTVVGVAQWS